MIAKTVGEAKKILEQYPDDLPIEIYNKAAMHYTPLEFSLFTISRRSLIVESSVVVIVED